MTETGGGPADGAPAHDRPARGGDHLWLRRVHREWIVENFPILRRLDDLELAQYLAVAGHRLGRAPSGIAARLLAFIGIWMVLFAGVAAPTMAYLDSKPPWMAAIGWSMVAMSPAAAWWLSGRYGRWRTRRARFDAVAHVLRTRLSRCASCDYDLKRAAPIEGRFGVARCPECGLVNPVAHEDSSPGAADVKPVERA